MPIQSVYGLTLSTTSLIPGLSEYTNASLWDIDVSLNEETRFGELRRRAEWKDTYASPGVDRQGSPLLVIARSVDNSLIALRYSDSVEFILRTDGTAILVCWPRQLTLEYVATYLLGPILGIMLRMRGVVALHASAIALDNCALAFMGPPGAGKSTTAAALAQHGYPVLSDDIVPLFEQGELLITHPGPPRVQLWAKAVDMLFGSPDALPLILPDWDKRALYVATDQRFQHSPLPLGAIYWLDERLSGISAPKIEALSPSAALLALVANTYANNHLDRDMRAAEFEMLHAVVERIPVRRVRAPADPAHISAFCQGVVEDFRALQANALTRQSDRV